MINIEIYAKQNASDDWTRLDVLTVSLSAMNDIAMSMHGDASLRHLIGLRDISLSMSIVGDIPFITPYYLRIIAGADILDMRVRKQAKHQDTADGYLSTDVTILELDAA